jgi:hypothetical protein
MDRQLHPLVNALARAHPEGRSHDAAHREVEKFQSICFHESYFGCPIMGNEVVVRLVTVPIAELFAGPEVLDALVSSFASATGLSIASSTLARMGRGYAQHALVLGSPLGSRIATDSEKALAEPRFLHGAWGRFDAVLARVIRGTLEPLDRAWTFYTAASGDAAAARVALLEALPLGSIDPQGDEVDLGRRYASSEG